MFWQLLVSLSLVSAIVLLVLYLSVSPQYVKLESQKSLGLYGVNVGGWLNVEDWLFTKPMPFVQDVSGGEGGFQLPPELQLDVYERDIGTAFSSEGGLTTKLYRRYGAERTIEIIKRHRESYLSEADFRNMAELGMQYVRFPIGWWAFSPWDPEPFGLVLDRWATEVTYFVPISSVFLLQRLEWCFRYGLHVLIDLHNLPGGSSLGSYNGVSPLPPVFWQHIRDGDEDVGYVIHQKMFDWYKLLPRNLQAVVGALQLLNEPAHLLVDDRETMLSWMDRAIAHFKQALPKPPKLYINLIATCFPSPTEFWTTAHAKMKTWAVGLEKSFVFFDVHHYLAWPGYDPEAPDLSNVKTNLQDFARDMQGGDGTYSLACSEFSSAFNHVSSSCTRNQQYRQQVFDAYVEVLAPVLQLFFWTYNCPYGYTHKNWWAIHGNEAALLSITPS